MHPQHFPSFMLKNLKEIKRKKFLRLMHSFKNFACRTRLDKKKFLLPVQNIWNGLEKRGKKWEIWVTGNNYKNLLIAHRLTSYPSLDRQSRLYVSSKCQCFGHVHFFFLNLSMMNTIHRNDTANYVFPVNTWEFNNAMK